MRAIKFRGKRKDNGKWVCGSLISYGEYGEIRSFIIDGLKKRRNIYEVYSQTVGQFTGASDKNKIDIFEGHIVEYHNERFIIKFIRQHAMFMMVYERYPTMAKHFKEVCPANVEIVGNIHEEGEE